MAGSRHEPDKASQAQGVLSWQDAGYNGPTNFDQSGILGKTFFTWVSPLMERGKKTGLCAEDAGPLLSARDRVDRLVATFEAPYRKELSKVPAKAKKQRNAFLYAIFRSHLGYMLQQSFWTVLESGFRIGSPVALRQLVKWLSDYEDEETDTDDRDGWLWAVLLCLFGVGLALAHHQLFWCGMRLGFQMKQQVQHHDSFLYILAALCRVSESPRCSDSLETRQSVLYRPSQRSKTKSCSSTAQRSATSLLVR